MESNKSVKKCAVKMHCIKGRCFYQIKIISKDLKIVSLNNDQYNTIEDAIKAIPGEYQIREYDDLVSNLLKMRKDRMRSADER